jgi:hypothetical protein
MMTYNFTFTTREEYLAYCADWRAKYKALALEIRANKRDQRTVSDTSTLQSRLHYLRIQANDMMQERAAATEFKNQQIAALTAIAA